MHGAACPHALRAAGMLVARLARGALVPLSCVMYDLLCCPSAAARWAKCWPSSGCASVCGLLRYCLSCSSFHRVPYVVRVPELLARVAAVSARRLLDFRLAFRRQTARAALLAAMLQVRLAERAPHVAGSGISGGAVNRFIRPDERWLEFEVGFDAVLLLACLGCSWYAGFGGREGAAVFPCRSARHLCKHHCPIEEHVLHVLEQCFPGRCAAPSRLAHD